MWENDPMKIELSDPFAIGLQAYFDQHPKAKPATVGVRAGLSQWAVRNILNGKTRSPRQENAVKIAAALGMTVEQIIAQDFEGAGPIVPAIAVAGRVGAGAQVDLFDAYPKGDGHYRVACPPQIDPRGVVAVEVVGDSMAPVYQPGTVLFYTREVLGVPTEALGRICVCEDDGGRAWVKQVKTGSAEGTFSLISINPTADTMHGVRLRWAAPVRLSLPPEFVERIDI